VILAVPASVAASLVASVDPALSVLCAEVPYVSTVSVALAYRRASIAHPLAGSGFVVARGYNDLRITACTWVSSKWDGRAPSDAALLRIFLGGAEDPDACTMSDQALSELAARDVSGVLGITGAPLLSHVHRWVNAGAQHNVGHLARLAQMDARLEQLPGLMLAGSGFRAIGIPDCIADGRAAAALAAGYVKMKAEGS
jgi:oxygen-dependent protoporphyrinogen oxidase